MVFVEKVDTLQLKNNFNQFYIADLRGKQSFLVAHLKDSLWFKDSQEIISYISKNVIDKPLLLLCFSKVRAEKSAKELVSNSDFLEKYHHSKIFFYDGGFIELGDCGLPIEEQLPYPPPLQAVSNL